MTRRLIAAPLAAAAALAVCLGAAGAPADRHARLVSPGTAPADADVLAATPDGAHVYFATAEALAGTGDTDAAVDVYERSADGAARLVSAGSADLEADLALVSDDGGRAIIETDEAIPGTGDTDDEADLYARGRDGALTLATPSTAEPVTPEGLSADGGRLVFSTREALAGTGDADAAADVYAVDPRVGAAELISAGDAESAATFAGMSADGARIVFSTTEALPATGDADDGADLYERSADGGLRLISFGDDGGLTIWAGATADGARVLFRTARDQPALGDDDGGFDVFERGGDGAVRLVSTVGSDRPAGDVALARDGSVVVFTTTEAVPGTGDADGERDVYARERDGALRLVSTPGAADLRSDLVAVAADGSRVLFSSAEAVPGTGDADAATDVYARERDGALTLVSTSGADLAVVGRAVSADGARALFTTREAIPGTGDSDGAFDVYERGADGRVRLVTPGTADLPAGFAFATAGGDRVVFTTAEPLPGTGDADPALDVYEAIPGAPPPPAAPPPAPPPPAPASAAGVPAPVARPAARRVARPSLRLRPRIRGVARPGSRLVCTPGRWARASGVRYRWLRGTRAVAGRAGRVYAVRRRDAGARLRCRVTAIGPGGRAGVTTAAVRVRPAPRAGTVD